MAQGAREQTLESDDLGSALDNRTPSFVTPSKSRDLTALGDLSPKMGTIMVLSHPNQHVSAARSAAWPMRVVGDMCFYYLRFERRVSRCWEWSHFRKWVTINVRLGASSGAAGGEAERPGRRSLSSHTRYLHNALSQDAGRAPWPRSQPALTPALLNSQPGNERVACSTSHRAWY